MSVLRFPLDVSEQDFQSAVVDVARLYGWQTYHTHDSRRSAAGFPDLVLWRDRVIFAELKAARGRVSPEQHETMGGLLLAGAEVYVWRPADFDDVVTVLAKRGRP